MNHIRALFAIFIACIVLASAYGIISGIGANPVETLSPSDVYVNYAGANPNSTYQYKAANGSPATLQLVISFDPGVNISSKLSYVYVTTPNLNVENWTYHYGSYSLKSASGNSSFIGSIGSNRIYTDSSAISAMQSTLEINIISTMVQYSGSISVHVVFTGIPIGVVY